MCFLSCRPSVRTQLLVCCCSGKLAVMGYFAFIVRAALVIYESQEDESVESILAKLKSLVFFCRHLKGLHMTMQCFYFRKDITVPGDHNTRCRVLHCCGNSSV